MNKKVLCKELDFNQPWQCVEDVINLLQDFVSYKNFDFSLSESDVHILNMSYGDIIGSLSELILNYNNHDIYCRYKKSFKYYFKMFAYDSMYSDENDEYVSMANIYIKAISKCKPNEILEKTTELINTLLRINNNKNFNLINNNWKDIYERYVFDTSCN